MDWIFHYIGFFFAALFVAKMIWLAHLFWRGQVDDDEGGPVSGWGTPKG